MEPGAVREIPLTKGKVALVDAIDYDRLAVHKWLCKDGRYAARSQHGRRGRRSVWIYMHREVLGPLPDGHCPDHINRDSLDNRRSNLRVCTEAENARNRRWANKWGFKGVKCVGGTRFQAHVMVDGVRRYSALYLTPEGAARAYDAMARDLHGAFACLNFPAAPAPGEPAFEEAA